MINNIGRVRQTPIERVCVFECACASDAFHKVMTDINFRHRPPQLQALPA